jgi:GT2 family glycosyltransferase
MIEFVSCTQRSQEDFWGNSALGVSIRRMGADQRSCWCIAYENRHGLPKIYNQRINATDQADILVFLHDDLWLDDYHLIDRVIEGMNRFDVLGLAGSNQRTPFQVSWAFEAATGNGNFAWKNFENLSGFVAHGEKPFGEVSRYGTTPMEVELLDGLFIAAKKSKLIESGVRFDERFDFHFYDLDFSRTAHRAGLRLGTWPIAVTHQSGGRMGTPHWCEQYRKYIEKWGD